MGAARARAAVERAVAAKAREVVAMARVTVVRARAGMTVVEGARMAGAIGRCVDCTGSPRSRLHPWPRCCPQVLSLHHSCIQVPSIARPCRLADSSHDPSRKVLWCLCWCWPDSEPT